MTDRAVGLTAFAVILAAFLFALRLVAAGRSGLFFDEAYYWQWSTNPMAGYFDHPPGIAWFIGLGTLVFGDTSLGVRFGSALAAPLSALAVWAILLRLTGERGAAAWGAIFASLSGAAFLALTALPDGPMVLFWLWAVFGIVAVYRGGHPAWWVFAGLMMGLAGDTKYTAAMLALGLFLWTLWEPSLRRQYRTAWPWLGLLALFAVMAPTLAWNAARGWPSLLLQTTRDGLSVTVTESLLSYAGLAVLMASPATFVLGLIGAIRGPLRPLQVLGALPIVAFLTLFALSDELTVNSLWPIAYWWALIAGLAMGRRNWWSRALAVVTLLVGLLIPFVYALFALPPGTVTGRLDLAGTYRGWPEAARAIEAVREAQGAAYIVADRYFYPGYLKMTLGRDAAVFHLASPGYESDYSKWRRWDGFPSATPAMAAETAIFVGDEATAALYYGSVTPLPPVARPNGSTKPPELHLSLVADPRAETAPLFNDWRAP